MEPTRSTPTSTPRLLLSFLAGALLTLLLVNLFSNNPLASPLISDRWCSTMKQMHNNMMGNNGGTNMMDNGMGNGMMGGLTTGNQMMGGAWPFGGYMFIGWILSIIFWAAIIWLIVWAIRNRGTIFGGAASSAASTQSSIDIAKQRFAKGEITKKEYEEIKRTLG